MGGMTQTLALFMALVLGGAAIHKLAATDRLAAATGRLLKLVAPIARPITLGVAALECAAAFALIYAPSRPSGALIAALVWFAYGTALLAARRRGESAMDCGCSFGVHGGGIDSFVLFRPFLLALLAIALAVTPAGTTTGTIEPLFAALALYALLLAAGELAALPSIRRSHAR